MPWLPHATIDPSTVTESSLTQNDTDLGAFPYGRMDSPTVELRVVPLAADRYTACPPPYPGTNDTTPPAAFSPAVLPVESEKLPSK